MLCGMDPHAARSRFLHGMQEIVDQHGPPNGQTHQAGEAAQDRLLALGASPDDLQAFARMVAFESLFAALLLLDEPGWALVETSGGERMQGLYEDLGPDR